MNELEIVQHRQIEGLSIFLNTIDYRTPHIHPEWELIWVLDQPLSVACGKSSFTAQVGQMVLFSPNEPHEFHKIGENATFACLQIAPGILPVDRRLIADGKLPHEYLPEEDFKRLKNTFSAVVRAYLMQEDHYALYCVGQVCLIFHTLLQHMPTHVLTAEEVSSIDKRNARLKRLIRFVDENYMHKIRLSDFARAEGCSMTHLSHFIKSSMNQTFQEYVNSVRFHRACELMAAGNKKMLEICMESGFSDYRYFSRAFQQQCGMTPEEYSRSARTTWVKNVQVRHSIHSREQFYSREDSLRIIDIYMK